MMTYISSTPTPIRSVKRNNVNLPKHNVFEFDSVGLTLVHFTLKNGAVVHKVSLILTSVTKVN